MRYVAVLIACTISVLWLSQASSAVILEYYGIEVEIGRNLHSSNIVTLEPTSPISHIDYDLDFQIYNLTVEMLSGTSICEYENKEGSSRISCDFFGMTEEDTKFRLKFMTRDAVRPEKGKYIFRETFPIVMDTEDMFVIVKLPERSTFSEDVINSSYFPPDGDIYTDGKSMFVAWERDNLTADDSISFSSSFISSGEGGVMWSMTVAGITAVVVIVMVSVGLYMRRSSGGGTKTDVKVLPLLNKEEKMVVDILAKHDGEVRQREIVRESDFSKAKVSRLIKNLKERGVIDTDAISGRENKIILKIKGVE